MPKRATALTAAAGEHFVAFRLSAMGYPVALTRGGSPAIDLMVADITGRTAISIQVKTSNWARRSYVKRPERNCWLWDVGTKAIGFQGDNIFYVFVDLKGGNGATPDAFVVPSVSVADYVKEEHTRKMFPLSEEDGNKMCNNWEPIKDRLGAPILAEIDEPNDSQ